MEFEMIEVKIPKWLLVELEKEKLVKDMKLFTAMKFYETNVLSLGKAAELAGENKDEFMEALSEHGVDVVRYSKKELNEEIGVLLDAKRKGIMSEVKPLLEGLMENKIRISKELHNHALELANED